MTKELNGICCHLGPMWFLSDVAVAVAVMAVNRVGGGSEGEGGGVVMVDVGSTVVWSRAQSNVNTCEIFGKSRSLTIERFL